MLPVWPTTPQPALRLKGRCTFEAAAGAAPRRTSAVGRLGAFANGTVAAKSPPPVAIRQNPANNGQSPAPD